MIQTAKFEDPSAERLVLAAALSSKEAIITINASLQESDFLTPHNRALYHVLLSLLDAGQTKFNQPTVLARANAFGLVEECGGEDYIATLFRTAEKLNDAGDKQLELAMANVRECSIKHQMYVAASALPQRLLDNATGEKALSAADLLSEWATTLTRLNMSSHAINEEAISLSDFIPSYLEQAGTVEAQGLSTGFPIFDERVGGLRPGTLTVVAARAKAGKSTMLMNWASHICYRLNLPVLYLDTEMGASELSSRLLAQLSGVNEKSIRTGLYKSNASTLAKVQQAEAVVANGTLLHQRVSGVDIPRIISTARYYHVKYGIGALFFDYLKITDGRALRDAAEHQLLGNLASALKDLAGELNIPVISATQVGRAGENQSHFYSNMIADSDRIARYCDTLVGLPRRTPTELRNREEHLSRLEGDYRMQVLVARGGGEFYDGINLVSDLDTLTFREAEVQPRSLREV